VTLSSGVDWRKWSATLRYRAVSGSFAGRLEDFVPRSPGFDLLDARVAYRAWDRVNLFVGALNLTNSRRHLLDVTDTRPAVGRQFYVGLSGDVGGE
jgi:outer membrane receptor protein involved in Fe transport